MGQSAELLSLIAEAASGETARARSMGLALATRLDCAEGNRAQALVAVAFADYLDARFTDALYGSERALAIAMGSSNREAQLQALSMRLFVSAGVAWAGTEIPVDYFALAWDRREELSSMDVESRMLAGHLLAEGALATGRIAEAAGVLADLGDIRSERNADDEARVPYPAFMQIQRARVLIFSGAMTEALEVATHAAEEARLANNMPCAALATALIGLVKANLDDRTAARGIAAGIERELPSPLGLLETGAWIVCAYALFAVGDAERASEFVLRAGGGPELSSLQIVDRALGYEILVGAALERHDLNAAAEWGQRSIPLAAHPAGGAVVEQVLARLDEATGNANSAVEHAAVAAARARLTGRYLEAARADVLGARALAAAGLRDGAVAQLTGVAHEAARAGVPALRRIATRELRLLGYRLPPQPGSGWSSLSEREQQIAILAADGFSNVVIGATLYLSARTVQFYMSRVFSALEIASRAALPRHVAPLERSALDRALPALTARQWDVARLVAEGCSNHEIAAHLTISVKTAEKHIGEILRRWGVTSRTSIARLIVTGAQSSAS